MKMTKKKVFVVALAICLVAIISMGTLAWFQASQSIENIFQVSTTDDNQTPDFSISLYENIVDPDTGKKVDANNLSIEIRIPLAEFGGQEEFEYMISHGNKIENHSVILYAQKINTVPYEKWDSNNADKVIVSDYELDSDEIVKMIEEELL